MEFFEILKALILGVVQGITEWLPISSTGHLILFESLMPFAQSKLFVDTFMVVIQFGSILAVVALYFHKLNPFSPRKDSLEKRETLTLWAKVIIAIIPAGIIGVLFDDKIDELFYNPVTVATMLIIYGILFIIVENRNKQARFNELTQVSYKTAFLIGMFQMLALIPGTSRSGATILGAVLLGCSRFVSAEFSFFMAIPTMLGASALKLVKANMAFTGSEWLLLAVGTVVSFLVSIFAIKFLMDYIKRHDFKAFGYYRIVLGVIVLAYFVFFI